VEILFLPFIVFIFAPPLALLPAVLLAGCFKRHRAQLTRSGRKWVLAGAGSWLAYAIYEWAVWVWSKGVTAPIRIDLLLIAPLLYVLTFLAIRRCWWARSKRS